VIGEEIEAYALRMKLKNAILEDDPILMGVSFGGMMAVELAKHFPAATVVQISSAGTRRQLPWWMKISGRLGLNRLLPVRPGKGFRWLEDYSLGVETEDDARLVEGFRGKTDPRYLRWALGQVVNWKNDWRPDRYFHVQGDRDRIFALSRSGATHVVSGAGHFMVYNRAAEVSGILTVIINSL
jgi:pimeloyl-ACP methyl ester carboxylesterase